MCSVLSSIHFYGKSFAHPFLNQYPSSQQGKSPYGCSKCRYCVGGCSACRPNFGGSRQGTPQPSPAPTGEPVPGTTAGADRRHRRSGSTCTPGVKQAQTPGGAGYGPAGGAGAAGGEAPGADCGMTSSDAGTPDARLRKRQASSVLHGEGTCSCVHVVCCAFAFLICVAVTMVTCLHVLWDVS